MTLRTKGIRLAFIAATMLIATPAIASEYVPPAPGADGYVTPTDPTRTEYSNRATSTTEGIAAPENQDTFAYPNGECWVVPNRDNPQGTAIFVPYKHGSEWTQFKANTPFGTPRRCTSGWEATAWSTCSASCDGTMTRTVQCTGEDGKVAPNSECAGAKPAEVSSCGETCGPPPPPAPGTITPTCNVQVQYDYTGADQYYVVPSKCNGGIGVRLWGAGGGSSYDGYGNRSPGGGGAYVEAVLPVPAGTRLKVIVGRGGCTTDDGACGYGGGGAGLDSGRGIYGAWGGGMAGVFDAATGQPLAIAGGGGGGAANGFNGGPGGAPNGLDGSPNYVQGVGGRPSVSNGGKGATTTAGGAAGQTDATWCFPYMSINKYPTAGSLYQGGAAGGINQGYALTMGGGGGGGLYGGGGGMGCFYMGYEPSLAKPGGGGSSLVPTGASATAGSGRNAGNVDTSKGWSAGIGMGGTNSQPGGNARVLFFGAGL